MGASGGGWLFGGRPTGTPPNAKMPCPSRKKSRFSGMNRLKRVRLTWASSSSTCAKSVFTVRSAVSFAPTRAFASRPTFSDGSPSTAGSASRSVMCEPSTYGFASKRPGRPSTSRPTSVAASDARPRPRRPADAGMRVRYEYSATAWTLRRKLIPHVCARPSGNRSDAKGIAISTVHPRSSRDVRRFHTVFQSRFDPTPSSVIRLSLTAPTGFVWNMNPLRRSWNVSSRTAKLSFSNMFWPSRRNSRPMDGSVASCQQRAET